MKLKNILIVAATIALASSSAQAVVLISLSGNPASGPVVRIAGPPQAPILDGRLIRLGTFADALGNEIVPLANASFADLALTFREFGVSTTGNTTAGRENNGRINRTNIPGVAGGEPDSFFVGKKVYIWIYNSVSLDENADQGIFASSAVNNKFVDTLSLATAISMTTFTLAFGQGTDSIASSTANLASGSNFINLVSNAPVPEPGSSVLLLLTVGGLGLARRRRHS